WDAVFAYGRYALYLFILSLFSPSSLPYSFSIFLPLPFLPLPSLILSLFIPSHPIPSFSPFFLLSPSLFGCAFILPSYVRRNRLRRHAPSQAQKSRIQTQHEIQVQRHLVDARLAAAQLPVFPAWRARLGRVPL
ncbi:hypothetical protein B0H14DRAFT_2872341, partial [Mycena olivaceomarginata]